MKQYVERGLDKSGFLLSCGKGSVTDDDLLNGMGDVALGAITTHHYSAAHDSPENKAFVEAFKKASSGMRPNFMAVGGYDGMHLIYEGLKKTNGQGGEALVTAMKGMSDSPRGLVSIDPQTRDIVQNIYVRKVERVGGELYNVEFTTIPNVKDLGEGRQVELTPRCSERRPPAAPRLVHGTSLSAPRRALIRADSPGRSSLGPRSGLSPCSIHVPLEPR